MAACRPVGGEGSAQAHYSRLAASYDQNWAYSPAYIAWMTSCILDRAAIKPGESVADIGCGTGLYARGLASAAGQVICADPSPAMLSQLPADPRLVPLLASAEEVASQRVAVPGGSLDMILMKEAIHHVATGDRAATLRGMAALLSPGGRIVVVMLPARIRYPLFAAALERFERAQPEPEAVAAVLSAAGLRSELTCESYELSFPKDRYLAMVRDRYMSLLAGFSDAEIERGVAEIQARYPDDRLTFADTFAFIRAVRP